MADLRWGSSWNQAVTPEEDFETADSRFNRDWERMDEPASRTNDPTRDDMGDAPLYVRGDEDREGYDRKERGFDRRSTERKAREYAVVEDGGLGDTVTGASGDTYDRSDDVDGPVNT